MTVPSTEIVGLAALLNAPTPAVMINSSPDIKYWELEAANALN